MPTDKERVVAYIEPELFEQLSAYQKARKLKSLSTAVVDALENYFGQVGLDDMPKSINNETLTRLKKILADLQKRTAQLSEVVAQIEAAPQQEVLEHEQESET